MHRKWHYTNNISNDDLQNYARSGSQVNSSESFEVGFIVEIYCRIQLLFGNDWKMTFQNVMCAFGMNLTEDQFKKLMDHIRCNLIPAWKRRKISSISYFQDKKIYIKSNGSYTYNPNTLQDDSDDEYDEILQNIASKHGNLQKFLVRILDTQAPALRMEIHKHEHFKQTLDLQMEIDANMQANWKDDIGLSYLQLRKLRKDLPQMAGEREVIREMKDRNERALPIQNISYTSENGNVVKYAITDLKKKIELAVEKLMNRNLLHPQNNTIKIKISGDGYLRTHKLGHVLFTFTFLDTELAHQSYATWDVCVLDGSEDIDNVAIVMKNISEQMQNCKEINIGNMNLITEYFVTSDQKFLALILGLSGATTKFFCPWCECPKEFRGALKENFPLRSVEHLHKLASEIPDAKSKAQKWRNGEGKGTVTAPAVDGIEFTHIVPDIMHIFIRITEKLLTCLYIYYQDDEILSNRYLEELRALMKNNNFNFKSKNNGIINKPKLDGGSIKFIIANLGEKLIYRKPHEEVDYTNELRQLSILFHIIIDTLWSRRTLNEQEFNILSDQINQFADLWIIVFNLHTWNNSCHILHKHVPYYLKMHGNLYKFSQEHVESQIGRMKTFLKQTASRSKDNTNEIMLFDNRKLDRLDDLLNSKQKPPCKHCNTNDHSKRTSKRCKLYKQ